MSGDDWIAANQRVLVAEFARLKAQLVGRDMAVALRELEAARTTMPRPAAIDVLSEGFGLTPFERDVLLLCAGYTMSDEFAPANASQGYATFGLALSLAEAHWSALTPIRPLRASRLIHVHDERAITTTRISLEERVLHYLAGVNYLDPSLRALLTEPAESSPLTPRHEASIESAITALEREGGALVELVGNDLPAQREVARRIAAHFGLRLKILSANAIPASREDSHRMVVMWNREAVLLRSALLIEEPSESIAPIPFAQRLSGLTFIAAQTPTCAQHALTLRIRKPDTLEQKQLWCDALGDTAGALNGSIDAVASQFHLDTAEIAHTALQLRGVPHEHETLEKAIWGACRNRTRTRLDDVAQRIEPTANWEDLVLPDQQIATLRQISAHARQRLKVHQLWGFAAKCARGLGISVLFSGESGTGKTLAAEVLANDLQLDLFRIDLSALVSKYIGETEKNLRRVFDAAEASGAILLFDEADALFGKRSEVRDSHDRYANIEVSYLLQRMEAYRGLAILTTNLKSGLDSAFLRRLQFVVQFPFPDADLRERIWRGVFPPATPLDNVNPGRLARLNVAGGTIRNIAMNAAFLAADEGTPVRMVHLLQAARSEATKRERPMSDSEIRGWA